MADDASDGDTAAPINYESSDAMESKIASALRSRESYLKEQADSLNMLKVRRLLETDLGLENLALDEHKKFIKQNVCEILGATSDGVENGFKTEKANNYASVMEDVAALKKEVKAGSLVEDKDTDDSPVVGIVSGNETTEQGIKNAQDDEDINESTLKEALQKRAAYFRANLDNITLAGVRRLLEDDLKLERCSLDPFKKFISGELDEIIKPPPVSESNLDKKKVLKNIVPKKASKKVSNEGSESSDSKDMESSEEEDASSRKHIASKAKAGKKEPLEKPRKRKLATNEKKGSREKSKPQEKFNSDAEVDQSESDNEKPRKRKLATNEKKGSRKKSKPQEKFNSDAEVDQSESDNEVPPAPAGKTKVSMPGHGKRVEQLKSVIKSCGIRIPPVIYKRAKQAPENKQDAALVKELEDILLKEGLSANPSEKEIKDVKKRKERERELEGIDMSNIVSSSRRRSTAMLAAPVKPILPVESDGSQSDDDDDDDGEDSDSEENDDLKDEVDEIEDKDDETKNDSQSEEQEEGNDEDSD